MNLTAFIIASVVIALMDFLNSRKFGPFVIIPLLLPFISFFSFPLAFLLGGIAILVRAADFLIDGTTWVARKTGVPPLITGIVIIGLGTSMPELFVNVLSAIDGSTGIALGNILGSNVANMGLVLGVGGLIAGTIKIEKSLISKEVPVMLGAALLLVFLAWQFFPGLAKEDQGLSFNDGLVLLLGMLFYLLYLGQSLKSNQEPKALEEEFQEHYDQDYPEEGDKDGVSPIIQILVGIAGLYFGGEFIVDGAVELAQAMGAGIMAIGILIGVGTSLPELAAAISSARKGEPDLIVGNVVGSNIFNVLLVLGVTSCIRPIPTEPSLWGHFAFLIAMSVTFFFFLGTKRRLTRIESLLLLFAGLGYLVYGVVF